MSSQVPKDEDGAIEIRNVWSANLEEECQRLMDAIKDFPYVAIDTEFPGTVYSNLNTEGQYETLKNNVNALKLIQLGVTLSDEEGNLPTCGTTKKYLWQFNFRDFDIDSDLQNTESIELLKNSGMDFAKNRTLGIKGNRFAELFINSGLLRNPNIHWLTFHGGYEVGYLLKVLTQENLPEVKSEFFLMVNDFFPVLYDIKCVMKIVHFYGGLNRIARIIGVERLGTCHQAGSDSLLASRIFHNLKRVNFVGGHASYSLSLGKLWGLNE